MEGEEPELVSRSVQAGIGLLIGVTVYSVAFRGLFALTFASPMAAWVRGRRPFC